MKDVSAKVHLIQAYICLNHLVNVQQYKDIFDHAQNLPETGWFLCLLCKLAWIFIQNYLKDRTTKQYNSVYWAQRNLIHLEEKKVIYRQCTIAVYISMTLRAKTTYHLHKYKQYFPKW